eukprot:scaffold8982_cov65-Phaeocystis_antarctica.AAC.2
MGSYFSGSGPGWPLLHVSLSTTEVATERAVLLTVRYPAPISSSRMTDERPFQRAEPGRRN